MMNASPWACRAGKVWGWGAPTWTHTEPRLTLQLDANGLPAPVQALKLPGAESAEIRQAVWKLSATKHPLPEVREPWLDPRWHLPAVGLGVYPLPEHEQGRSAHGRGLTHVQIRRCWRRYRR